MSLLPSRAIKSSGGVYAGLHPVKIQQIWCLRILSPGITWQGLLEYCGVSGNKSFTRMQMILTFGKDHWIVILCSIWSTNNLMLTCSRSHCISFIHSRQSKIVTLWLLNSLHDQTCWLLQSQHTISWTEYPLLWTESWKNAIQHGLY